uniref:ribosomal protein L19 n=1 Tax=Vacuolaria virescens TaxID=44451 RepID=UPI0021151DA3|nr:ribosomal protein L19 [Vacuolaria virescens]UTE94674.1 ribosomal protein L19 [Vacuolaria virescens]
MIHFLIVLNLILKKVEQTYLKTNIPSINVGDSVRLGLLIKEGDKERIQYYQGITISKKNAGINKTITVRRVMQGIGIERLFLINSPRIVSFELKKSIKVKRGKLYYLRKLAGKSARLK